MNMNRSDNPQLPHEISQLLARLRRWMYAYVWTQGLATLVVVLGIAFWLGLLVDWSFEPSAPIRIGLLIALAILAGLLVYRKVVLRSVRQPANKSLALLVERRYADFQDSLITSVELASIPETTNAHREMFTETNRKAVAHLAEVRLRELFNLKPLLRVALLAGLVVVSIGMFGLLATNALGFYLQRLRLSEQLWPRYTRLIVDGFPKNESGQRIVKIAKGRSLEVAIKADNSLPIPPPKRVEVRYQFDHQGSGRADVRRIGNATIGVDAYQQYAYTFQDVFESLQFDVVGGDDRVRSLRIQVVDSPKIIGMTIDCQYPPYMDKLARNLPVTGAMQIPQGAQLRLVGISNKALTAVRIHHSEEAQPRILDLSDQGATEFAFEIARLDSSRDLLIHLTDIDGIDTLEPYRLALSAISDEAPQVDVQLAGIGVAITPQAKLPVRGHLKDDYGIAQARFAYRTASNAPSSHIRFNPNAGGETEFEVEQALDVQALGLQPSQKFIFQVEAVDRCQLGPAPNVGVSRRFVLDVVTPEELRASLERRELLLRKRFEAIYQAMQEARDGLAQIDLAITTPDSNHHSRLRLQISRSLQDAERVGHETMAVAREFEAIRAELINNRLDTEEVKSRLKQGISDPLLEIGGPLTSTLKEHIEQLGSSLANQQQSLRHRQQSVAQADFILVEMKQVLNRMLELESFNEVLELMRGIIRDHADLKAQTQKQRKAQLRSLLED